MQSWNDLFIDGGKHSVFPKQMYCVFFLEPSSHCIVYSLLELSVSSGYKLLVT